MSHGFLDIAISPGVRAAQEELGVADLWGQYRGKRQFDTFGNAERAFIESRDSFYIASVSETGWPYVQHRGGPTGFVKVLDEKTLAFADYRGNLQYISVGNFSTEGRACLFFMDYPRRARLKVYVNVEIVALDQEPDLLAQVAMPEYGAQIERVFKLTLAAFDWNCAQHITPRFTEGEVDRAVQPLRERLAELEAENAALRARLEGAQR